MITQRRDMPVLTGRPPITVPRWKWWLGGLLGRLLMPWLERRYRRREGRLNELMRALQDCQARPQLEALLGPPVYALEGNAFSSTGLDGNRFQPDVVEVYVKDGCEFQLWFSGGVMRTFLGCVPYTLWEIVTNMAWRKSLRENME